VVNVAEGTTKQNRKDRDEKYAHKNLQRTGDPVALPDRRALATGCSGLGAVSGGKQLALGYIDLDENVAVSTLTKVLLEEKLGYEVELQRSDEAVLRQVYKGVAEGDLDAFQDVWIPNQKAYLSEVEDEVEHLDPWFEGKTEQGLAVP
jgi:glycine betaine/proline transport system substrate-binding protein